MEDLKKQFNEDMITLCKEIKAAIHNPTRFIQMLSNGDTVDVVKRLVANEPTETFIKLAEKRKLSLTVEYYVVMPKYRSLFDDQTIRISEERLAKYKF